MILYDRYIVTKWGHSMQGTIRIWNHQHASGLSFLVSQLMSNRVAKCNLARLGMLTAPGLPEAPCVDAPRHASCFRTLPACDRVRSCVRPQNCGANHTAGRHGDTRIRCKSTRRALSSWSLGAFPNPDQTDRLPLTSSTSSHARLSGSFDA